MNVAPSRSANDEVDTGMWKKAFYNSRWFSRGWTLQELLAPKSVEFFSADSVRLGDRQSLLPMIHEITGIPREALGGSPIAQFSVDERLSWASNRETKRSEDRAYCLLGIFNVFMPLIYGEGAHALDRLRREIDKKGARNIELNRLLSTLPFTPEAAFNSLHNQHEATCLSNTRAELLRDIEQWVNGDDGKCILWLNGLAGTGKSTVARTIARNHYESGDLAASFFFSRGGGDRIDADKFVTTIARQLANKVPSVRDHICEAIKKQEDIANHTLRDQWEHLIVGPLRKLGDDFSPSPLLIVVDALDECDQERDIELIIKVLATARSLDNIRLRILITSRPDILIRHLFHKIPETDRKVLVLHEISPELVDRDIGIYFEEWFSALRGERGFEHDWPGIQIVKRLVEVSCGLFIWASTACRFIRQGKRLAMTRIHTLVNGSHSNAGPEKQLDQIYTDVLRCCIPQESDEEEKQELCENLRDVLGSIAILRSPLAWKSLAGLLDIPLRDIQETLADLHPILNIPSQESHPIRLHHPTFRDFLLDAKRCGDADFCVSAKEAHAALADHCLRVMSKFLKRDICGLGSPGILREDVEPELIALSIPPELQYACLYWVEHNRQSGRRFSDNDQVARFFKKHFLHWLEAINLIGKSDEMGAIVRLYHALLQPSVNVRQIPFVKDARRFMFTFQNIFRRAPLQIYCTGLAFVPTTNELKSHFNDQMHTWIHDIQIAEAVIPKAKDEFNYVSDLAFTPDCRQIASGSNFGAVRFWDIATRTKVHKFDGADDKMSSVAISPDGTILAAGSDDFTVIVWDLNTKQKCYTLNNAHLGWVNSVVFSPDGKTLASGSMDETVALWEVATGRELRRLENQSSCVNSVTFSPDGSLIATGSVDKMVRLWNISRNSTNLQLMLDGHSGCINSVKFSPHGDQVISGSDDMTIKLWDTASGDDYLTLKGHEKKVMTVAFSSNSQLIASGSEDKTIRLWDAARGTQLRILKDHSSGINTVLFSPDGNLLASSSFDDEVRLWDAKTWKSLGKLDDFEEDIESGTLATQRPYSIGTAESSSSYRQLDGHSSKVTRLVFSPDGLWLVSGSEDATIKLWQGGVERFKLEGHSGQINDLMFSSDSVLLGSASADGTLILWSPSTGTASLTLRGHSGEVSRVLFSPNSQLVASCYADSTVVIWTSSDGRALKTVEGRSGAVTDIAFSPDNRSLASSSADATLTIWDIVDDNAPVAIRGHDRAINSVRFSQDGKLLVSCSEDGTIRLWSRNGASCGIIGNDTPSMTCATFSPDSRIVASVSNDGKVSLWDTGSMSLIRSFDLGTAIRKITYSKCGQYLETDRGSLCIGPPPGSPHSSHPSTSSSHPQYLFVTEDWLIRHGNNLLCLPAEFLATDVAVMGNQVVLGHVSGSVSFISVRV